MSNSGSSTHRAPVASETASLQAPKVSVLLPTYNYARYIDEAIQSVLSQTFTDYELVIVDDASTDNTEEIVAPYLSDPRVTFYRNPKNLGLVGNFNKCLEYARGPYIKFVLADDKFAPDMLQKFVDVMDRYPNVSLVTSFKHLIGGRTGIDRMPFEGLHEGKKIIHETLKTRGWLGEPTLVMFRKANLTQGAFNPQYTWLVDWEMWIRQLSVGDCYIIPEPLSYIRTHDRQVTSSVLKNYTNYFEEYRMYKAIREGQEYRLDLSGLNMDQLVKMRATRLAQAMLKLLPRLHRPQSRRIFTKAFRIAYSEKVIAKTIIDFLKRPIRKKPSKLN